MTRPRTGATFLVTDSQPGFFHYWKPNPAALAFYGPPAHTYHVGPYTVLVWDKNLLAGPGRASGLAPGHRGCAVGGAAHRAGARLGGAPAGAAHSRPTPPGFVPLLDPEDQELLAEYSP